MAVLWYLSFLFLVGFSNGQNLIANPDFEGAFSYANNWYGGGCDLDHDSDAFTGNFSGRITNRVKKHHGVSQRLDLVAGEKYRFSMMIKLLNNSTSVLWHHVKLMAAIKFDNGQKTKYNNFGRLPTTTNQQGWQIVGGDFTVPNNVAPKGFRIYITIEETEINYLVDTASLILITDDPNWKSAADARIDSIRKNDITMNVQLSGSYAPSDIKIEVNQTRSDFAFGAAVNAGLLAQTDSTAIMYRDTFLEFFEWAVIENRLKWKKMEPNQYDIRFDKPDTAIGVLQSYDIPVRGHSIVRGKANHIPNWLGVMNSTAVANEVIRRTDYVVNHYKDKLVHWDVDNENLHGLYFEETAEDVDYADSIFQRANQNDPNATLFLNDYNIVSKGTYTSAMVNKALNMLSRGIPVQGIGAQSHLDNSGSPPDIALIKDRVERLGAAGLPVWISELDYEDPDVPTRAQVYEDMLRLYYSMEEVEGVLLWGFWNQSIWREDAALVEGSNFQWNEAGQRVHQLLQDDWKTKETFFPSSATEQYQFPGFQGRYTVTVYDQGQSVYNDDFYLTPGQDLSVDVSI